MGSRIMLMTLDTCVAKQNIVVVTIYGLCKFLKVLAVVLHVR